MITKLGWLYKHTYRELMEIGDRPSRLSVGLVFEKLLKNFRPNQRRAAVATMTYARWVLGRRWVQYCRLFGIGTVWEYNTWDNAEEDFCPGCYGEVLGWWGCSGLSKGRPCPIYICEMCIRETGPFHSLASLVEFRKDIVREARKCGLSTQEIPTNEDMRNFVLENGEMS